jgi:iron complex outermembrane receptor protein
MRSTTYLLAGVGFAGCLWSTGASAQDATADDAGNTPGNEIVVTAQFREQALQDTPLAITAINSEMLEARGQINVQQIGNQAPNVTLKPASASWGPSLTATIRGVGQYNFHPALEPGVGVFIDDVYFATLTGSMFDLVDVERVEILRGPQGTLTGRNSIGGAIRVISQLPQGDGSGYLEATVGEDKQLAGRGSVDFAFTDKLFSRVSIAANTRDGYVRRLDYGCANPGGGASPQRPAGIDCQLGDKMGGEGSLSGRMMLRFIPSDTFEVLLSGDVVHERHTGPAQVLRSHAFAPEYVCGKWCNYATYTMLDQTATEPTWTPDVGAPTYFGYSLDPTTRYDGWGLSGRITAQLNDDMELLSITAFRKYDSSWAADGDLTPASTDNESVDISHRFFSQELRLNGEIGKVSYTIGGYYSDQKTQLQALADIRPFIPLYITDDPVPASTYAAFATVFVPITDKLTLTAGVRYTHEKKDYTFYRRSLEGVIVDPAFDGLEAHSSDSVFDYRLSLDYRWTDNFMTYVTFSTGFKGGGVNPLPTFKELALPFKPEKLQNIEVGFKSNFLDNRVRFNVTGFYNDYSNVLQTRLNCADLGFAFCSLVQNVGTAHNKGVEVELNAEPVDGFEIDGAFSYLDFEFVEMLQNVIPLSSVPTYVPSTKWSLGAQYRIDLSSSGSLTPRVDASYQSSMYTNAFNAPTNRIAPYTVANASLTWRNEADDLSVAIRADNLLDKYYVLANFDVSAFFGMVIDQPARPRTFSVTVKKEF